MSDVTRVLDQISAGDQQAANQLLPLIYDELRKLAIAKMAHERPGQTLQATALVHEAYLRLVGDEPGGSANDASNPQWNGRGHFFAAAAEAMRRILVDAARKKQTEKHGGDLQRQALVDQAEIGGTDQDVLALDEALHKLSKHDPIAARVVELRYFAGLGHEEIAPTLDLTIYRARQKWTYARAWLRKEIG